MKLSFLPATSNQEGPVWSERLGLFHQTFVIMCFSFFNGNLQYVQRVLSFRYRVNCKLNLLRVVTGLGVFRACGAPQNPKL